MEKEIYFDDKIIIGNDSSFDFDEDINEINDTEKKNDKEKINIIDNKYFEEADLNEIYDVLNEINKAVIININKTNKINYHNQYKNISNSEEKINNINNDHSKECQEILSILKKPLSNKNIRNRIIYDTPFKPLLKPKKISLVGKIFIGSPSNDSNTECSSKDNNIDSNNNNNYNNNNNDLMKEN